jgi:2-C-methyl-D-erythritol 4-phosphate cytidylyltransferase
MPNYAVILPAAGRSSRFRDKHYKKPFAPLAGQAVWLHAAQPLLARDDVKQLLVVVAREDREEFDRKFGANVIMLDIEICQGGAERIDSIRNALGQIRTDIDLIAIHDAARPCLASNWIDRVFTAAAKHQAAILAIPVAATLKRVAGDPSHPIGNQVVETVARNNLWAAQTPQVFQRELLLEAYAALPPGETPPTDDAQLVERLGKPVMVVEGSPLNLKITTRDDLKLAEQILPILPKVKAAGFSHPFAADDLWK